MGVGGGGGGDEGWVNKILSQNEVLQLIADRLCCDRRSKSKFNLIVV